MAVTIFEFREWIESISLLCMLLPFAGLLLFMLWMHHARRWPRWRRWWGRYLAGVPVQWCTMCGRAYWGGFPLWNFRQRRWQWLASYKEFCSRKCADEEVS